jgi:hypothetical protein
MPLALSRADARRVAAACRSLAFVHRRDADKLGEYGATGSLLRAAENLDRLAKLFDDHAVTPMGAAKVEPPAPAVRP